VLAFTREHKDNCLLVVIPRLTTSLLDDTGLPLIPAAAWGDTQVLLPSQLSGRIFTHSLLSNARCQAPSGRLPVAQLLDGFPVHLSIARSTTSLQPNQSTFKTPTPGELHDECS
jgi:(1->4)-alpha-D-glucan 1-alpha-D-glucosylmutase